MNRFSSRPAQKCWDIQVFQMRFAFGTVGAFVAGCIPGYASAFFGLAGHKPGVLLFEWLIEIDVERCDRHWVCRGRGLRCSGGTRGRGRLFDQDRLRLQGEGRWFRRASFTGCFSGAGAGSAALRDSKRGETSSSQAPRWQSAGMPWVETWGTASLATRWRRPR